MTRLASRTARLRRIEELLLVSPDGLGALDLAERLDVDRRTVYRDLDFLSEENVPLWQHNGRFGINRTHYLPAIRLSFQEATALVLAGLLLARLIDEHNPHVASALRKLAATLPSPLTQHLERAANRIQAREGGISQVAVLDALAEGWGTGRKVRACYRSPRSGSIRERIIAPYALEATASGIYVIGHDEWSGEIRTFKLDRLESADVLDVPYMIPTGFDPEVHLAASWGIMAGSDTTEVVLRFSPAVASHVRERRWHPSQTLEPAEDGGSILRVRVSEPLEMQPWLRSWGAQVEVISPGWLRDRIGEELQQAAARYVPAAAVAA